MTCPHSVLVNNICIFCGHKFPKPGRCEVKRAGNFGISEGAFWATGEAYTDGVAADHFFNKHHLQFHRLDAQTVFIQDKDGESITFAIEAEHNGCNDPGAFCVKCRWDVVFPQLKLTTLRGRTK